MYSQTKEVLNDPAQSHASSVIFGNGRSYRARSPFERGKKSCGKRRNVGDINLS
jgi:hypothetical protein